MKTFLSKFLTVLPLAIGAFASSARAAQVTNLSALGANDLVDWNIIHPPGGASLSVTSNGGLSLTISEPAAGFQQVIQGSTYTGHFPNGAYLENNQFGGPVTIAFGAPVSGIGLSIEDAFGGHFAGAIQALHGITVLETYSADATNSPVFLGVLDATPDITSVIIKSSGPGGEDDYFAFGNVSLVVPPAAASAPEPASLATAALALTCLLAARRRTRASKAEGQ